MASVAVDDRGVGEFVPLDIRFENQWLGATIENSKIQPTVYRESYWRLAMTTDCVDLDFKLGFP
jgi:hypothetical protein